MVKFLIASMCMGLIMVFSCDVYSQSDRYSLLTEPFIDRPLSMHKGQIQINPAYQISISGGYFENDRAKTSLLEDGASVIGHSSFFNIKYGLFEYFELGAEMNYFKRGIRNTSLTYLDLYETVTITELIENKGFEDLLLSGTFRLPLNLEAFDIAFSAYYLLPVSSYSPESPNHSIESIVAGSIFTTINLHETIPNGQGVSSYGIGSEFKLRFSNFAVSGAGSYLSPTGEGLKGYWLEYVVDEEFVYEEIEYAYLPMSKINANLNIHYQPSGWLHLFGGLNLMSSGNGWFERNSLKYGYPEVLFYDFATGFEIQISPSIRLMELMKFPIGGQNSYASFSIFTGLSFNMFTGKD